MNTTTLSMIIIGLFLLGLLTFAIVRNKKKGDLSTNYRTLFIIGIVWLPIGIATKNPGLWGVGLTFFIAGLVNKDKWEEERTWSDLSSSERRTKLLLIGGLMLLLLAGIVAFMVE